MNNNVKKLCCFAARLSGCFFGGVAAIVFFSALTASYTPGADMVWALEGTDAYTKYTIEVMSGLAGNLIAPVISFMLARLCFRLARTLSRRRRDVTISAQQEIASPFILYLRSFDSDRVTSKPAERLLKPEQTEEQLLVSILDDLAPVVAVGRPNDQYLPKGADRLYVPDEMWQERVTELAHGAEFVALRLGSTNGFWWEAALCLEQLPPDKLLFIIPALKDPAPLAELERRMLARGIHADLSQLSVRRRGKSSIAGFLTIENNKAVFTPIKRRPFLDVFISAEDALREALSDFLRANGGYVRKRSLAVSAGVSWAVVLVTLLTMVGNTFLKYHEFQQNRYPKELIALCESSVYSPGQLKGLSDQGKIYYIFADLLRGSGTMDERSALELYDLSTQLLGAISDREYELLLEHLPDEIEALPTDLLIVAKRYFTSEGYDLYLSYLVQAVAAGNGQDTAGFDPLEGEALEEFNRRLEQSPWYEDSGQSISASHRYYIDARDILIQMYGEGYAVESAMRGSLVF